ncbi:SMP-30 gluconolaconase LRE domain [Micractinium conductrix]|uniref:SMP-30 gluconolaconase LRE domain n=1 Tax=Micractinium conductrix TaxID=554055 RepID=A0A2P6VJE3_9CHLO|nr:SMP-30 gluconolaconase LRE domain [Micractinium conductrix]|eukprot:PSC74213.1 SMP-30 gluconolaconase LRE domain [Micractinium conductrix]
MAECELACDAGCDLGESPIWDERTGRLYFVDINGKRVHVYEPASGAHRSFQLDQPVGTIALTSDPNKLLAALERDIVEVDATTGATGRVLATSPEEHGVEGYRHNDGKATPQGSLLVGRMHSKWRDGNPGRLYALHPCSSELVQVLDGVGLPNGMAWDEGKQAVFFVDSAAETITAFAADDKGTPKVETARVVSHVPTQHKHVPDGMTIDSFGNLWVALGESGAVVCYSGGTGQELRRVSLPVKRPTACTFGGDQLQHLYVTTRVETGESASPNHGGLFRVAIPGVHGAAPAYKFQL